MLVLEVFLCKSSSGIDVDFQRYFCFYKGDV